MSRQARQRRRRHNRARPDTVSADRRRRARHRADRRRDRGGRLRPQRRPVRARDRERCTPIIGGGSSQVFAADGTRLGFIQSDELRTPGLLERNPERPAQRDRRDRGSALLQEQRRRPDRHLPRGRQGRHPRRGAAGRLDDHDAARCATSTSAATSTRSSRRSSRPSSRSSTRRTTPSARSSRATSTASPTARSGGRRRSACRRRRGSSSTSPPRQLEPAAVGAARRACRRRPRSTTRSATRTSRGSGATRCSRRWPNCTTSPPRRPPLPRRAPLEVKRGYFYSQRKEDFFFEYVRQQLTERYGAQTVAQGGLKVHTTIDLRMQSKARKAIAEVLNEPEDPASAIVTINPANGDIEAMAESQSYEQSQYNLASAGAPPARLDVQGDRARRRALARGRSEQHLLPLAHARARAGCPATRPTK